MRNLLGLGNINREDIPPRIVEEVANLLRTSDFLKVSNNGQRIGRGTKLSKPEEVLEQVHRRTLAASPFEYSIKMEDVSSFFSQYAKVNSVRLPPNIADKRRFCGTALVEFSSEQDTQDILRQSLVYAGADLVLIPKSDFDCQRENMIKQLGKSESHNESVSCFFVLSKRFLIEMQLCSFLLLIFILLQIPQRTNCQICIEMDSQ
jgi:lupus La protein